MNFAIYLPPKAENGKCLLSCTGSQVVVTSRVKMRAGTLAQGLVSMSTPPRSPGRATTACTPASQRCLFLATPWGGHRALKNPGKYKTCLCLLFATICNPSQKAFNGYLEKDKKAWEVYDVTVLAASYSGPQLDILIDQGSDDQFLLASHLLPDNMIVSCSEKIPVVFRLQPGYDHSYFFINDHIKHHAKFLNA
ncbi:S-formylglutathione hydrolase-like [Salvelinus fontinalis]|uniref:S-formylglutathione hydrolase-like n=1 Tax=Salvelinus fontinalis TaxID=8038 RepID=UPI002485CD9B|nr:S-formylglutathione hydrolase-like [Salvelinus fontinalis]